MTEATPPVKEDFSHSAKTNMPLLKMVVELGAVEWAERGLARCYLAPLPAAA